MVRLSVLDHVLAPPGTTAGEALAATADAARLAERLGYTRVWFSEHHNAPGLAGTAPEVVTAHVAAATERIRVGAGGVMLPNHAPLKVAEVFRTLEALHPGRIDLGLGRAPGTDNRTAAALRGTRAPDPDFAGLAADLLGLLGDGLPDGHPHAGITAAPEVPGSPEVWVLGSSDRGAAYAAAHGLPFAFAHQIDPDRAVPVLRRYRDTFRPSARAAAPLSAFSAVAFASEDPGEVADFVAFWALYGAVLRSGAGAAPTGEDVRAFRAGPRFDAARRALADRVVAGAPDEVARRLRAIAAMAYADEVVVATPEPDPARRRRSLELLAAGFGIGRADGSGAG
ncbi:MsnO8 family LLM class oxidoreductase [Nocardiopsis trehalosi]|uniref:MsnO8 family LLM class oxidoreductase n=1 Tax=Nocardiopsis trehalosi TaxID=109329 RepID=UPI00082A0CA7|nr:MsnO8 family LLM class oxidoreductase [Nocardiopsis trehalosi]